MRPTVTLFRVLIALLLVLSALAAAGQDANVGETRSNYSLCRDAEAGCDPRLLSIDERRVVAAVENGRNFSACVSGRGRCDWTRLSDSQLETLTEIRRQTAAEAAERRLSALGPVFASVEAEAKYVHAPEVVGATKPRGQAGENGSYYGQLNANGVPKTVAVKGYYRKDGTYVRGHYRSKPKSNPKQR